MGDSFFEGVLNALGDCDLIEARAEMRRLAEVLSNSGSERDLEVSDFLAESSIYFSADDYCRGDVAPISRLETYLGNLLERMEGVEKRVSALLNDAYECFVSVEAMSVDNRVFSPFSREKISDRENFNLIRLIMEGKEDIGFESTVRIFELQTRFYLFLRRFGVKSILSLGRKSNIKKGRYAEFLGLRERLEDLNYRLKLDIRAAAELEGLSVEAEKIKGDLWWSREVGFNLRSKFLAELRREFDIVVEGEGGSFSF